MKQVPILFYGDSPDLRSGLARIGRDLATHVASLPEFRVGYLGRGGHGTRQAPFMQYCYPQEHQWGENHIESVWEDFAGAQEGIIFTIQDASRMHWFARPRPELGEGLYRFLTSGRFKKWGYFPIDATGPNDRLTGLSRDTLLGYDRVLAYTKWGAGVIERTIGRSVDWIPHGINLKVWKPRDKKAARMAMGFKDSDVVVGCVMTNQARKDWGLWAESAALLRKQVKNLKLWAHIDILERHWSLPALIEDFGLSDIIRVTLTGSLNDEGLSYWYSGCDVTMLPSSEGFGFPIVESRACGTPCVHGDYGGGSELANLRVPSHQPEIFRLDTLHNCYRPVYQPRAWSNMVLAILTDPGLENHRKFQPDAIEYLDWTKLWLSCWKKWFLEGLC